MHKLTHERQTNNTQKEVNEAFKIAINMEFYEEWNINDVEKNEEDEFSQLFILWFAFSFVCEFVHVIVNEWWIELLKSNVEICLDDFVAWNLPRSFTYYLNDENAVGWRYYYIAFKNFERDIMFF